MSMKQRKGIPQPDVVLRDPEAEDEDELMEEEEDEAPEAPPVADVEQILRSARTTPADIKAAQKGAKVRPKEAYSTKLRATSAAIRSALSFYKKGTFYPVQSDEQLKSRIEKFLSECADEGQIPTFEKLCLAVGYPKAEVSGWELGTNPGFSPKTGAIIRQAKLALAAIDADLAMQGQIQSSIYQFRAKNYSGMREQGDQSQARVSDEPSIALEDILKSASQLPGYKDTTPSPKAAEGASETATEDDS